MLVNYIKVAIRNLRKNKIFSAINIFGLAMGLTCFMLIAAFLYDELNFDKYPQEAGQIYRIGIKLNQNGGAADYPYVDVAVGAGIKDAYPEVIASTRLEPIGENYIKYGDKQFKESHIAFCDSNFLQLFSISLIEGNPRTALVAPRAVVISKAFAKKYFGDVPAMGKTILAFGGLKVTGIFDKVPDDSHFHFDAFVSMATDRFAMQGHTWSNIGFYTYILLAKSADPRKLMEKFPDLVEKYIVPETVHDMGVSLGQARKSAKDWHFYLLPLTDIHLYSNSKYEIEPNSDIQYVYIFTALAIFILLLACVNFTNLSTASSARRSREVGIRKALGSSKKQLIAQFLVESILLTFFALLLALVIAFLLLPAFNQISDKHIVMQEFLKGRSIAALFGLALFVGVLAGIYPSFFLSSFQTIAVLKGAAGNSPSRRNLLRSSLVVFQFMTSTTLIIATIVVYQQLHFMQNKKLGYDKDQVLMIQDTYALHKNQLAFKQELLKDKRVINVSVSRDAPVDRVGANVDGSEVFAKENKGGHDGGDIHAFFFHVDYDYLATLGMKMAAGRYFSQNFSTDSTAVVINESAVKDLGWKDNHAALDKTIISSGQHEYRVIGVVQDFNYTSAKQKIAPLMMMLGSNNGSILVKIHTADVAGFIANTRLKWAEYNTETPFSYYFLDDRFRFLYKAEQKTGQIFSMFAVVALIIACLGLFGLVAFTTQRRTKEIGLRKVLGASINQVLFLLAKEFLVLVSFAFLISIPVTWWAMHNWLNSFAYRINIGWEVFLVAGATAMLIAVVTVSFQALKAAMANPVTSLRTE